MANGCLAIGSRYSSSTNGTLALGESQDPGGSTWAVRDPAPIPGTTESDFSSVSCVSCVSTRFCTAVGESFTAQETTLSLGETWNGTSLSVQKAKNP
jgi:hypothetical protein